MLSRKFIIYSLKIRNNLGTLETVKIERSRKRIKMRGRIWETGKLKLHPCIYYTTAVSQPKRITKTMKPGVKLKSNNVIRYSKHLFMINNNFYIWLQVISDKEVS